MKRNVLKVIGIAFMLVVLVATVGVFTLMTGAEAAPDLKVTITGADNNSMQVTLYDLDANGYYDISTVDDLYAFATAVNGGNTEINGEIKLSITVNAADATEKRAWTPIGTKANPFVGSFTGNYAEASHVVSGLYFNDSSAQYVGLFGYVGKGAEIKNIMLKDASFTARDYVGGIAGRVSAGATLTNCYIYGSVSAANKYSGGITGYNDGTITCCNSVVAVTSTGSYVGGIAGQNGGVIQGTEVNQRTSNHGKVIGANNVGGIAGINWGKIAYCSNYADVTGKSIVGGLAGKNYREIIFSACTTDGTVSGASFVGGLVGENTYSNYTVGEEMYTIMGDVVECSNEKNVVGSGDYIGGLVGRNDAMLRICYNLGDVTGTGDASDDQDSDFVGGVAGNNSINISDCFNGGEKVTSNGDYVGGVLGRNHAIIEYCYSLSTVSTTSSSDFKYLGAVVGGTDSESDKVSVTGCYYLKETASGGINGADDATIDVVGKTLAQFQSGEVTYLLNNKSSEDTVFWRQQLGVYKYPLLRFDIQNVVYCGYDTCIYGSEKIYTNDKTQVSDTLKPHTFGEDGFCTVEGCGAYQPATLVTAENAEALGLTEDHIGYYAVSNAGQLLWTAETVSNGYHGAAADPDINIVLTDNITLNENLLNEDGTLNGTPSRVWLPIGKHADYQYTGTFDGNGHTVSGLYFDDDTADYVGLFGYLGENGVIKNVGVIDSYFNGYHFVGGVVGHNHGTVTNSYNTGKVSGTFDYIGGVVGYNYGTVEGCYNAGDVSGRSIVGGVVGCNYEGIVTNCYNAGKVSGIGSDVGGVVGYNNEGTTVANCYNVGNVSGNSHVGAVVGSNDGGTVTNCYYLADAETDSLDGTTYKTETQFASGEVAYLLNGDQSTIVFGQNIDNGEENQGAPVIGGARVYYGFVGCKNIKVYTNNAASDETLPHNYDYNGFCTECGGYEPAELVDEVYQISNAGQLYWFADKVNNDNESFGGANAILTENIVVNEGVLVEGALASDISGFRAWTPIGYYKADDDKAYYTGTFDGDGYTVSGLYFNDTSVSYVGLFGSLGASGKVKNVGVLDSYFKGKDFVGGVAGYTRDTLTNCYNAGVVSGNKYVGGVAGYNSGGTVTKCYNTGAVSGDTYVGGVVGENPSGSTLTNCYNMGAVSGSYGVGGVVGNNFNTVTNCYNAGAVSGTGSNVGGVVGYNKYDTVTNCYYLSGTASYGIGGGKEGGAESKTLNRFKSGEVAYLLNGNQSTIVFGQTIGEEDYPVLGGATVYKNTYCSGVEYYANAEEINSHVGGTATCKTQAICDVCGKSYGELDPENHESTEFTYTDKGDGTHTKSHACCGAEIETAAHSGGTATCKEQAKCEHCEASYGELAEHTGGTATCKTPAKCSVCGTYYGSTDKYNHESTEFTYTDKGDGTHTKYHVCCNAIAAIEAHTFNTPEAGAPHTVKCTLCEAVSEEECTGGTATCVSQAICDVCGKSYGALDPNNHASPEFTYTDKGDGTHTKYHVCCGVEAGTEEHTLDGNGFYDCCGGYQPAELVEGVYQISNAGQLYWFADKVNNDNANFGGANAVLTANIVVNSGVLVNGELAVYADSFRKWTPIGNNTNVYSGTFDGNNKTVSGLYFDNGEISDVGLFGGVGAGGKVQNVGVIDSYFNGDYFVGGVVGRNNGGTVTNCYSTGNVSGTYQVGGVVGYNDGGTVKNCYNEGDISGADYVGGVVGYNDGVTVENCYNTGSVSGNTYVGGVVGWNNDGTVTNCYNTGKVSGRSIVGGVVGDISKGTVKNCYNAGKVSGTRNVGGVVGYNYIGTVTNCYYLKTDEINTALGGISGADAADQAEAKTEAQFESGEVAYLLNGDQSTIVFGQNIDNGEVNQGAPVLGGAKIYTSSPCVAYSNTGGTVKAHAFDENGFCTECDGYEPAEQNAEGYYEIGNAGQLYWFAQQVNSGNTTIKGILTANIVVNSGVLVNGELASDTTGFRVWTPIGYYKAYDDKAYYTGTFDGNNKTVSGLYFNNTSVSYVGLFGGVGAGGKVQNVGVIDSYFNGDYFVGGVVGTNYGTVENCYNTCKVLGEANAVGGVVGNNSKGTVTNCYNKGTVSGSSFVGGAVGYNDGGTVTNCYNTGKVSGTYCVGGAVGDNTKGTVTNCYNTGKVSGTSDVGGVVGYNYDGGTVTNCYYLADAETDSLDGTTYKTETQFASGEVAYLLNGDQSTIVFGQTIGTDALPVLGGATVYKNRTGGCTDATFTYEYSNTKEAPVTTHSFDDNGFCTLCDDGYEPAEQNESGYYEIGNAGQLYWFAQQVNSDNANFGGANAILTENIVVNEGVLVNGELASDISGFRVWTPIGNNTNVYSGTFDGNNKTVSGLYFNDDDVNYVGLFGYLGAGGTVKNVGVLDSYFNGDYFVGGVVGYNNGTVESSYNTGDVSGSYYVGGVVGDNYGTVESSYNTGDVSGTDNYVGGVVGYNYNGTVKNCYNTGDVSGTNNYVGGVVGYNNNNTVENCYNEGDVSGSFCVGGVVGYNFEGTVESCYNEGDVSGTNNYVGGVVGYNFNTVTNCYNTGDVSGTNNFVGGVVGYNFNAVENCYYLETDEINTDLGGINGADAAYQAEAKTEEQFKSGEVAYLLNGDQSTIVFGQTIGTDASPTLGGETVYRNQTGGCTDASYTYEYSNIAKDPVITHSYVYTADGATISCDCEYCEAKFGTLTLSAEDKTYDGTAVTVTVTKTGIFEEIEIEPTYTKDGTAFTGELVGAGTYVATVTYNGASASVEFTVAKATPTITAPINKVMGGYVFGFTVETVDNTELTYEVLAGTDYSVMASKTVVRIGDDVIVGNTVTVKVKIIGNENYETVEKEIEFEVGVPNSEDVTELKNKIAELIARIKALEAEFGEDGEVTKLKAELAALKETVSKLDETYTTDAELAKAIGALNNTISALTDRVKAIEDTYATKTALEDAVAALQNQINSNDTDIAAIKTSIETINGLIKALGDRLDVAEEALKTLNETTIPALKALISDNSDNIEANAEEITALKTAVTTAQGTLNALAAEDDRLEGLISELNTKLSTLSDSLTALADRVTAAEKEIEQLKQDLANAIEKLNTADKANADALATAIETLNAAIEAAKKAATDADSALKAELEAKINAADKALQDAIDAVQDNLDAAVDALEKADKANADALAGAVENLTAAIEAAEAAAANADAALKTALETAIANGDKALKEAIDKVASDLADAKAELDKAIADGDKALDDKITALNAALEAAKAALEKADADNKAELETAIANGDKALKEAIDKVASDLADAKAELEQAISDGDKALDDKITALNAALEAAKAALEKADADNKAELETAIANGDKALKDAIDAVQKNLDDAKAELEQAIADGDKALDDKITALNAALEAAKSALEATDAANKTALETAIADGDKALQDAIDKVASDLADAKAELEQAIADGDKALDDKITALNAALEAAKAALEAADAANKTALETAIANGDKALQDAIDAVQKNLDDAKAELEQAIADGDKALDDKITALNAALEAAKAALEAANNANKAELEEKLEIAEATLNDIIEKVVEDLANAKEELEHAIENGEVELNGKIEELNTALDNAVSASEAANGTLKTEITNWITQADTTLEDALKAVQKNLDDLKAELEISNGKLQKKDGELQAIAIVACVVSTVALGGSAAFVIWFFIDRKKRMK